MSMCEAVDDVQNVQAKLVGTLLGRSVGVGVAICSFLRDNVGRAMLRRGVSLNFGKESSIRGLRNNGLEEVLV